MSSKLSVEDFLACLEKELTLQLDPEILQRRSRPRPHLRRMRTVLKSPARMYG
jgi:hypothetical protein